MGIGVMNPDEGIALFSDILLSDPKRFAALHREVILSFPASL